MKQLLHPLYNALHLVNNKAYINISEAELDNEEGGLGGQWLLDMLDKIIDELEIALKNSDQNQFSLAITLFNSVMGGPSADLWNTDELLVNIIKKMPSIKMNHVVFKSEYCTVSNNKIMPHLSLVSKKKNETCHQVNIKISPFLRKNSYVCLNKNNIKVYDKIRQLKAVFNQDGSYHIEKTKANLDKKLRLAL